MVPDIESCNTLFRTVGSWLNCLTSVCAKVGGLSSSVFCCKCAAGHRCEATVHETRHTWFAGGTAWSVSVHTRSLPDDVHQSSVDNSPVFRLQHGWGKQQVLSSEYQGRSAGPQCRVRPGNTSRLWLRQSTSPRRCRHGRGCHWFGWGYEGWKRAMTCVYI